jgi:ketosteroid isomerase-like protein
MRATIRTILLIAVVAPLAASCSTGATEEAAAAEPTTTVATTTTTEPPLDPANKAAATQEANTEAFLAQDLDAVVATYAEDIEFINSAVGDHRAGTAKMRPFMTNVFRMTDPDATEIIEQLVSADGTFGVVNTHWVGENFYGVPMDLTYVQLMEFEDGLISKLTMYWEDRDANDPHRPFQLVDHRRFAVRRPLPGSPPPAARYFPFRSISTGLPAGVKPKTSP